MAISDNDAKIILGMLKRQMATTEAVLDVVTSLGVAVTALATLLTAQQASLTTLTDGLSTEDEILEELKAVNEKLTLLQGAL